MELGHLVEVMHFPYEVLENREYQSEGIPITQTGFITPKWTTYRFLGRFSKVIRFFEWYPFLDLLRQSTMKIRRKLDEGEFDIIEATSNRGLAYGISRSIRKRPSIVTRVSTTMKSIFDSQKTHVDLNYRLEAQMERAQIRRSDSIVTHTQGHAKVLEDELGINADSFEIIPHGISLNVNAVSQNAKRNEEFQRILYVGRFEHRKGIDVLLRAIPDVLRENENIRFHLIGRDDIGYEKAFRKRNAHAVNEKVSFLGQVDAKTLQMHYEDCTLFVAPSRYESFGLIYAEAMAHSKPVIGCKVGGVPEVVVDGSNGLLIEPDNSDALTNGILDLLGSEEKLKRFGEAGRQRVERLFGGEKMCRNTIDLYEQLTRRQERDERQSKT